MFAESHARADLQAIVENIEMTEGRAFRVARSSAGKLNIDRIVRLQCGCNLSHLLSFNIAPQSAHLVKVEHTRCFFAAHTDDAV